MSTITVYLALLLIYSYSLYCTTMVNSGAVVPTIHEWELKGYGKPTGTRGWFGLSLYHDYIGFCITLFI